MKNERISFRLAILISLVLTTPVCAFGAFPETNGRITGVVSDEQDGKVAAATVYLTTQSGIQLTALTDQNGTFAFTELGAGTYFLQIKANGFSTFSAEPILLTRGQSVPLQIRLRVAAVNETVVITATGTPQDPDDTAKVVSVLDSQQLENKHVLALTESLRGMPGVRVQQQGSPGSLATIRLRGQRSYDTAVLFDGLRVRDASDINGSAVSLFSDLVPISIDRVEVLRGSGSSIYGTNAIGGVVNVVPMVGSGPPNFEVVFEAGSLATFRERLKGAGGGGRFGYSFALNRIDVRHGIDGEDQYGNTAGTGRLQFAITPSLILTGNFYGTTANARLNDSPIALPAAFAASEPFPKARPGVNFQPDFNNPDQGRRNRLLVASVKLAQQINEPFSYSVAYQRVSSNRRNYNGPAIDPEFQSFYPFGDFEFSNVNNGSTDTFDARLNARLGRFNFATAGFEFERESLFQQSNPSFSAFNNTTDVQRTFAVFGQDQLSLLDRRLQFSFAVRGQFFRISAADRPGFLSGITAENSITGDGAVAYFVEATNTKLRAHAGNGFRAPSLFERFGTGTFPGPGFARFGDPTLKPEQSISVDAGIDQRLADDRVLLGVTYFYTRLQRVIAFTSFLSDPLGLGRFNGYVNEPGGLARGVETFGEAKPTANTTVRASYTYTNSDRATSSRGLQPEYVIPKHLVGLSLNQRYRSFLFNLELNHTGSYIAPVFENNFPFRMAELRFGAYTKADGFASYERQLSERVTATFFGGAENLFDREYFENGFRAPGIVARGGVKFKF